MWKSTQHTKPHSDVEVSDVVSQDVFTITGLRPVLPKYGGHTYTLEVGQSGVGPELGNVSFGNFVDPTGAAIRELSMNVSGLRHDIQELSRAIKTLAPAPCDSVVYRDINKEQATAEISRLLKESANPMYASDISGQLGIEYELVDEILSELEAQGKIK